MSFFFMAHSGVRYLVLLAAVAVLVQALVAAARGRPYDRAGSLLMRVFVGVVDLQVLLGVLTLLTRPFFPALAGHITMMVLAAAVAHVTVAINRRRPDGRGYRRQLVGVALSLVLIVGGILAIGRPLIGGGTPAAAGVSGSSGAQGPERG